MRKGENIIYGDHLIWGQIIQAPNVPEDIEAYECVENEVKIMIPLYDKTTGELKGLRKTLPFINIRRDEDEVFFNHGFDHSLKKHMVRKHYNNFLYLANMLKIRSRGFDRAQCCNVNQI